LSITKKLSMLQANPWFEQLPTDITQQMIELSVSRRYSDGEKIHSKGDEAEGMLCIVSGVVRASNVSLDGKEAVLTYLEPGSWFGEISLLDGLPRTHDAYAQGETEILLLPRQRFNQLMEQRPELYRHFNVLLCQRIRLLFTEINDQALLPLSQRLIKHLLRLAEAYGKSTEQGLRISLKLSQDELALLLSASRQSINKELKKLENANLLITDSNRLLTLVDVSKLRLLAAGAAD